MKSSENYAQPITMDALLEQIPEGNGVPFWIHFDEVGFFKSKIDDERSQKLLYCIWFAAEKFQKRHHFCVLSGRSHILHAVMGKQFTHFPDWRSPYVTVPRLPTVRPSCRKIFNNTLASFRVGESILPPIDIGSSSRMLLWEEEDDETLRRRMLLQDLLDRYADMPLSAHHPMPSRILAGACPRAALFQPSSMNPAEDTCPV